MARIQIELDNDALKALDAEVAKRGGSRESFIADAMAEYAAKARKPEKPAPSKKTEDKKD